MNGWSSTCSTPQMANNLVKWWKTKFLNGYKSFSVEPNDERLTSDTEELLERRSSDYQTSCTTPPLQTQSTTQNPSSPLGDEIPSQQQHQAQQHHLNLQEFSCDVSVEGGPDKTNQERQEFSFTLYDFDGHGKITKDDIAGLVTTIYEVLGSSVRVPHYGSKTIKVKLTVSPDQRKHVSATVIDHKDNRSEDKPSFNYNIKNKKDSRIMGDKKKYCRHHHKEHESSRKHYCCRKLDEEHEIEPDVSEDVSDVCSRVSPDINSSEDEEGECSEDQAFKCNRITQKKRYQKHSTTKFTIPNQCNKELNMVNQKDCFLRTKKVKKRSSSLQKQELLEIIQSNMDKNNTCFHTTRKQTINHTDTTKQLSHHQGKHRKHRHKDAQIQNMPLQYLANVVDPTHFYVDLASLQNSTKISQNGYQYDKLIDAVMCVSNKKMPDVRTELHKRHNRSKSYDATNIPVCYQLLEHPVINVENVTKPVIRKPIQKITDHDPTSPAVSKNIRKIPHVVLGHTSAPHHLKHRNRQEDQARAMAQVVQWLEQEFSSNLNMNDNAKEKVQSNCWTGDKQNYSCNNVPASPSSGVERHEHHHVHEHIHHHYHHYQDAPVVV